MYADALAHAIDQERSLNAVRGFNGEQEFDLSPQPAGAPLTLAPMDGITVRMRLLADEDVETAWGAFVSAWDAYYFWGNVDGGVPGEDPPESVVQPLRAAIADLKVICRRSLERDDDPDT